MEVMLIDTPFFHGFTGIQFVESYLDP